MVKLYVGPSSYIFFMYIYISYNIIYIYIHMSIYLSIYLSRYIHIPLHVCLSVRTCTDPPALGLQSQLREAPGEGSVGRDDMESA